MLEAFISMMLSTMILSNGVDGRCVANASQYYNVPPSIILSIMKVEGGKIGTASKNKNGTYDLGPMQINTIWLKKTKLKSSDLMNNGCVNVFTATWILRKEIDRKKGSLWGGVASYHSRTPKHYRKYVKKVYKERKKILINYSNILRERQYKEYLTNNKKPAKISVSLSDESVTGLSKMKVLR